MPINGDAKLRCHTLTDRLPPCLRNDARSDRGAERHGNAGLECRDSSSDLGDETMSNQNLVPRILSISSNNPLSFPRLTATVMLMRGCTECSVKRAFDLRGSCHTRCAERRSNIDLSRSSHPFGMGQSRLLPSGAIRRVTILRNFPCSCGNQTCDLTRNWICYIQKLEARQEENKNSNARSQVQAGKIKKARATKSEKAKQIQRWRSILPR